MREQPLNEPPSPLGVLRYRDFRLLWTGQVFSMIGSRMQGAALLWHLYVVTGSKYALGWMGLARVIPILVFALLGGLVADALDRRRLMLVSQTTMGILAAVLGVWTWLGLHSAWPIYLVAGLTAGAFAFDGPARQSMIPTLVPRDHLAAAVSLNSLSAQVASILGPTLMGLIIQHGNIAWIYWANAASFLAVIIGLLLMRPQAPAPGERPQISIAALREGLQFVGRSRLLIALMLLDFVGTFFSSATVLLPVYARDILHVGPSGYGWLVAAASVGSLGAAAFMTLAPPIARQGFTVLWAVFLYGAATVVFGLSTSFWLCFLALAGTGAADTISTVLRQTIRQLITPDALRGRMTAINMLFFQGGPQLGELEAGLVAGWMGPVFSVVSGGFACVFIVAFAALKAPWLREYRASDSVA